MPQLFVSKKCRPRRSRKPVRLQLLAKGSKPTKAKAPTKPTKVALSEVKRGYEILCVSTDDSYIGTVSAHGKVNRFYSFTSKRGSVKAANTDLATLVAGIRQMYPDCTIARILRVGR